MPKPHSQSPENYLFHDTVIGEGGVGKVTTAYDRRNKRQVAVKTFNNNKASVKAFHHEMMIHSMVSDMPHTVSRYASFFYKDHPTLIMELMDTDLLKYLQHNDKKLEKSTAISLFYQVCLAIQELHHKNIAHLDIKPENFLIKNNTNGTISLYVCDFGHSVVGLDRRIGQRGTPIYCAPELKVDDEEKHLAGVCDIWSLGVLLYILLTGCFPARTDNVEEFHKGIVYLEKLSAMNLDSKDCLDLLNHMLCKPEDRFTIDQILQHPYLAEGAVTQQKAFKKDKKFKKIERTLNRALSVFGTHRH